MAEVEGVAFTGEIDEDAGAAAAAGGAFFAGPHAGRGAGGAITAADTTNKFDEYSSM